MAASDAFYRDQKRLNTVFAITSVAMLVTLVWMFADDFNRAYKGEQRTFRTVESELNKRTVLALAPTADTQAKVVASEAEVVAARDLVAKLKPLVDKKAKSLIPARAVLDTDMRNVKAEYDSKISYYNISVEQTGPDTLDAKRLKEQADAEFKKLEELRPQVEELSAQIDDAAKEEIEVPGGERTSLVAAERKLKALEASHKKLTGDFDRFLKLTAQKQWKLADTLRALPVLDGFASPVKVKQTFHDDLPIDYGGFKYVTRYDRCTTCHLGIDKPGLDQATLLQITKNPSEDAELQTLVKNAQSVLEERQKANADKSQDVNLLAARDLMPKQVNLSPAQVSAFASHPRLDLYVSETSPHAMEKFGCSICHGGQGSATGFVDATHTPNDAATITQWKKDHDWKSIHFWDFPMMPKRFVESGCVKCHYQIEDLVTGTSRVEAPKLMKGYHLTKELGCFGCHEFAGMKGGRMVGPDLRLEPEPPLESLSPADRAKRLADTANPPGTQRKVGPSMARIAEKTYEDWAMKWMKAPRVFRPDTKMPHFYVQANNSPEALPDDQKKFPDTELRAVTHYIFAKSRTHLANVAANAKRPPDKVAEDEKLVAESSQKLANPENLSDAERKQLSRTLREARTRLAVQNDHALVETAVTLPTPPADDAAKKLQLERGRQFFATKGCVACHQNEGTETPMPASDGKTLPAFVGESHFGPELGRVAAKLGKSGDPLAGKKWLVQWLLNPMVHSPRTLMPSVHLQLNEADDVATWLLSLAQKPDAEWDALTVAPAERETLATMTRMYLRKAGLTTREVEGAVKDGFTKEQLAYRAEDADEHELVAPLDDGKLLTYIGKKAIGNLGCYGCHNIPGFEAAKPIGVGLNDWGKKEVERIAFEDADHYVKERYHEVAHRDDPKDPSKPAADWKLGEASPKPLEHYAPYDTSKQPPYEKYFADMLSHSHRQREGFLHLKLMSPRAYDYNRIRDWNDRARMPQFKFARTAKLADESDEAYKLRSSMEEAEGREAVMTFILGLIAEPIPQKFVYNPSAERAAEIKGRQVIEKYNCYSCHMIRPGQFELKLTNDKLADGRTYKAAVLNELIEAHKALVESETADPKDRPFPEHSAWGATPPPAGADRLTARGEMSVIPDGDNLIPTLRLSNALAFNYEDPETKKEKTAVVPANPSRPILFVPQAMKEVAPQYGGRFALLLKRYLTEYDAKVYGDVQPIQRLDDETGQAPNGYAALPPPLLQEGERVQPGWLFQFLLNPKPIRKIPTLQMPKFSLSEDEAIALVNYFTAVNKIGNPGVGLSGPYAKVEQRDEKYLMARTQEYVARLKTTNLFDERVNEMKPLWARVTQEQLTAAEVKLASARTAKEEAKVADTQKEIDSLKSQLGAGDFPSLKKNWEEREAYVADAWKLVTYPGNLCLTCHQVGPALPTEYRAPNLDNAWERLRPEWTERWIAYPQRLTPYASLMQPQYKPSDAKKHAEEAKVFPGTPDDQIRASRDLLMMFPMIADWPVIKYRAGASAFGPPAPPAPK